MVQLINALTIKVVALNAKLLPPVRLPVGFLFFSFARGGVVALEEDTPSSSRLFSLIGDPLLPLEPTATACMQLDRG